MTLTAGGAGFEGGATEGRPRAWPPGRPFIEESVAPEDAA